MTDRELMQMALDALIDAADSQNWEMQQNIDQHGEWYRRSVNLKQSTTNSQAAIEALRARLAQPELEPVAQMREMLEVQGRDGTWNYDTYSQGMYNGMEFMVALAEGREPVFREPPERWLHTPPQREWKGLTKEEARELCVANVPYVVDMVAALEARLKEKNT